MTNQKPKILISACLEHCKCRYDGSVIENSTIKKLMPFVTFDPVCPEMGIGLPSPREAIRVIKGDEGNRLVDSYSGTDRTEAMDKFIDTFLESHHQDAYDAVILKCKSPTCGIKEVKLYKSSGKVPSLTEKTQGFFGKAISEAFDGVAVEDEGRLKHFNIREHFFMSLFLRFNFRQVKENVIKSKSLNALVSFHSDNKYLYMAYHQKALKEMGKIVANHEKLTPAEVVSLYENAIKPLYTAVPSAGKNTNMLLHLFGYFKNDLSGAEKAFFLDQLSLYQSQKMPFSAMLSILESWVVRFNEPYLKRQTIFHLFPRDLIDVTDSGKGI